MKNALEKFKSLKLVKAMGFNRVVLIGVIILMCLLFCRSISRVAAAMIFSWVASAISNSPVFRPSHMTMIRSDMRRISGSSEEIMTMAFPEAASWFMSS